MSTQNGCSRRAVVILPTYNEAENIEAVLEALVRVHPDVTVAVIDDSSPDGTAGIAARVAAAHPGRIEVLSRPVKDGLGCAYRFGFRWAIDAGYDVVVQMDADGSHPAGAVPGMISLVASGSAEVVVGSRYVPGGSTPGWPVSRRALSRAANLYARAVTGVDQRDATAGFKAWQAAALARLGFEASRSNGYGFQVEMALAAKTAGLRLVEVPIVFTDRRLGSSKLSGSILAEGAVRVWRLRRQGLRLFDRRPEVGLRRSPTAGGDRAGLAA